MSSPTPGLTSNVMNFELADLEELAYDMGGFKFGRGTPYNIATAEFGDATQINNDAPLPRGDGIRFGRDYRGGRLITFEGNILTTRSHPRDPTAAPLALNLMETAWDAEELRLTSGAVIPLRMERYGRVRRVYGRPRRFSSTSGSAKRGRIPFGCDFQCIDHYYYDDLENQVVVGIIPEDVGGLEGDLIGDLIASSVGLGETGIFIDGTKSSWLIMRIYGPILNPSIEIVDQWRLDTLTNIAHDDSVVIDPSPWNRSTRRASDGANLAGIFTASSPRISAMRVPPGVHQVILRGIDPTGTAHVELFWRNTYGSY